LGFGTEADAEVEDVVGLWIDLGVGGEGRFAGELAQGIESDGFQRFQIHFVGHSAFPQGQELVGRRKDAGVGGVFQSFPAP
jgi:hypothetical protein